MKAAIPETLKAELPQNSWGKVLGLTPVILTVIATLLAGLASGEMTRAQYVRALAAQLQSKAGDQWGYFQAKKLRGALQENSLEVLRATIEVPEPDPAGLGAAISELSTPGGPQTLAALEKGQLPAIPAGPEIKSNVQAVLDALNASQPEEDVVRLLALVTDDDLKTALDLAQTRALAFDAALKPVNTQLDQLEQALSRPMAAKGLLQGFTAARLRLGIARYDQEARLNQVVAYLYELQVRKANAEAERHHQRSGRFFYGMLAAQMAVVISTLAIAARQKNLLWSLAAAAGLVAVSFSAYVFLKV
jgi:hypothetical protein